MTSKVTQNILNRLYKQYPERNITKIYNAYIKNVEILNNQKFYFSDFFLQTDKTIYDFELEMYQILKVHFVNKITKRIFKKTTLDLVSPEAFSLLLDFYDKWREDSFVIFKNNFKRQESIKTKADLKMALYELLKNDHIYYNIEMIRNDIKEHNRNSNDNLELIKVSDTLFYIKISVLALELLQKYSSPKYCIKEGYKNIFENVPFTLSPYLCFDFNPNKTDFKSFIMISDMDYLEFYDYNNELTEVEMDNYETERLQTSNPEAFNYIEQIFEYKVTKENIFARMKHEDYSKSEKRETNVSTLSYNLVVKYLLDQNGKNQENVKMLLKNINTRQTTAYYLFKFFKNNIKEERTQTKIDDGLTELLNLALEGYSERKKYSLLEDLNEVSKTGFFECSNAEIKNLRSLEEIKQHKKAKQEFTAREFVCHSSSLELLYDKILFEAFSTREKEFMKESKQVRYLMKNLLKLNLSTLHLKEMSEYIIKTFSYDVKEIYFEYYLNKYDITYSEDRQKIRHIWSFLRKNDPLSLKKMKIKLSSKTDRIKQNELLLGMISKSYGFNPKYKEINDDHKVDFESMKDVETEKKETKVDTNKKDFKVIKESVEENKSQLETKNIDMSQLKDFNEDVMKKIINEVISSK